MSNFLAVATVTGTLRRILQSSVGQDVSGATVTSLRPDGAGGLPTTGVNLFLYHITPNPDWRNQDLPTRRSDGSAVQLPEAAIDLNYLISFFGDDAQLESHRLLGSVTRTLHARPILTRQAIADTLADPAFSFLAGSDLSEQIDQVRLVPMGLTVDEMSQLWSGVFHQSEYHLSVAYRASVVLLTATEETPSPALPVKRRQLLVVPFRQPAIDRVADADDPQAPIVIGSTLRITGRRLRATTTKVRLAGQEFAPADADVRDPEIRFLLDAPLVDPNLLRAGVQAVQVIHPFVIGSPPEERGGAESNVAPLVLRPQVSSAAAANVADEGGGTVGADVTADFTPPAGARQRVNLLLNSVAGATVPQAYSFPAPARTNDLTSLTFAVAGVVAGTYLVRLQVDGADSPLTEDTDPASPTYEQFTGPTVQLEVP